MKFPKRTDQHLAESESWKILLSKAPKNWIVRELSERDYGIDAYIEIASTKGDITGELCSIQLKGSKTIDWREMSANFSIKMPTVNYWMGLPVPVFMVWTDNTERRAFFAPVKSQVREKYDKYLTQKTLGFEFLQPLELGTELGLASFPALYLREKYNNQFRSNLREVLINCYEYCEFMQEYQNRDAHLGMEPEEEMRVQHLYSTCRLLAELLGVKWEIASMNEIYRKDREDFGDKYYSLHQNSVNQLFKELEPVFLDILKKGSERVSGIEAQYWRHTYPLLFHNCETMVLNLLRNH